MAYTIKQARPVLLNYLGLTESTANYIKDTDNWGILFEKNGRKCVIFIMPLGENTSSPKIYFDIRDSGAEKFVAAWNYAEQNNYKFFCLGVKDESQKYKDYIISVEADIHTVLKVSGLENGRRSGAGTQLNVPSALIPEGNITRAKSNKFDIFFAVINKEYIFTYLEVFDNRLFQFINASKTQNENSNIINKPRNRIIFGAPGTGKSNLLAIEQKKYFPIYENTIERDENIENAIKKELSDKPTEENLGDWAACIAIKYSAYFRKLQNWFETEKPGGSYNDFLNRTFDLRAKQPEIIVAAYRGANMQRGLASTDSFERVTFHPNYSYAQFVGTYKPVQDSNDDEKIRYEYVPGPFIRTFIKAKKTGQNVLLLIEEINRANVAAVFGDVFQLLDRDENGNSEYPITTSEDLRKFLAKPEYLGGNPEDYETISIPSNMYIWATMNSADQGVFPMDTAFKRRWEFEYIGIDENEKEVKDYEIPVCKNDTVSQKIYWNELRKALNDKLISLGVNEDKLLGPFFLSKSVLESAMSKGMGFVKLFESKVLMYLFEDAAKMKVRQLFNLDSGKYIYSEVCKKFEKDGLDVFFLESAVTLSDLKEESQNE